MKTNTATGLGEGECLLTVNYSFMFFHRSL